MSGHTADRLFRLDGDETLASSYDAAADVLYLWRGAEARPAVTVTSDEGHLVRLDPDTYEIVGFTIFDFEGRWDSARTAALTVTVPAVSRSHREASPPQRHRLVAA